MTSTQRERQLEPWDVAVVGSATGSWVHLVEGRELHTAADPRALCGNAASRSTQTWFALNGRKRCCKAGLKAALEFVVDVEGRPVKLRDVLAGGAED